MHLLINWAINFDDDITRLSQYQNVSILDFIGAEDDGGGGENCSYKMCKAAVKSSPLTNKL